MTKPECVDLIRTLLGAYPNTKMDNPQGTLTSYMLILGEYDTEIVCKAARMYMGNAKNRYFPKAADLKKYIPLAPYMFNPDAIALPSEAEESDNDDGALTGCDICPYANTDWVDSPNGCHRRDCIV